MNNDRSKSGDIVHADGSDCQLEWFKFKLHWQVNPKTRVKRDHERHYITALKQW